MSSSSNEPMLVTNPKKTVCRCCGRNLGFAINDSPASRIAYDVWTWGCIGKKKRKRCSIGEEGCNTNQCPITRRDVYLLSLYWAKIIGNILQKAPSTLIELSKDIFLYRLIRTLRFRKIPMRLIITSEKWYVVLLNRHLPLIQKKWIMHYSNPIDIYLGDGKIKCPHCYKKLEPDWNYCITCGNSVKKIIDLKQFNDVPSVSSKNY